MVTTFYIGPYIAVLAAFILALVYNGGSITLGDKSNHELLFHPTQVFYRVNVDIIFHCLFGCSIYSIDAMGKEFAVRSIQYHFCLPF